MTSPIRICVNSQTPLVRFKLDSDEIFEKYGDLPQPIPLETLAEGEDYEFTPGGVTRIVAPLLTELVSRKFVKDPQWAVLSTLGPESFAYNGIIYHAVKLPESELSAYGHFKEAFWRAIHAIDNKPVGAVIKYYDAFADYNWASAKKLLELHSQESFDLFYIHDFQQILTGSLLGPVRPKILRWHIPFYPEIIEETWRGFITKFLETFEGVIVSCKCYEERLRKMGLRTRIFQLYPHLDEKRFTSRPDTEIRELCSLYGVRDDERLVLAVGRMDPMKGQDCLIRSAPYILKRFPKTRFLLIGNGSFSTSKRGGMRLPKGNLWRQHLQRKVTELGLEENVIFAGYMGEEQLKSMYIRSDIVVLPSYLEGFGLVVVEAWLYKKPVVASRRAGVSELIREGENGLLFTPGDDMDLVEKISKLLTDTNLAENIGRHGYDTARTCYLADGTDRLQRIFEDYTERN